MRNMEQFAIVQTEIAHGSCDTLNRQVSSKARGICSRHKEDFI